MLFLLFAAHFLCDYPLQGDFLAKGKNPFNPLPGVPWFWCMLAHSFIHAGAVYLITGSLVFGIIELVAHFYTDYSKCAGRITFNEDQITHLFAMLCFAIAFLGGPR